MITSGIVPREVIKTSVYCVGWDNQGKHENFLTGEKLR